MKQLSSNMKSLPIKIVGGNIFGKYPKISSESTYNMYISDEWLVSFAGYFAKLSINPNGTGRGIFNSSRSNKMIVVIDNNVYKIDEFLQKELIGTIDTYNGDVYMDENDKEQIAISDLKNIYIYDYTANTLQNANVGFRPGYISFQDGYFVAPDLDRPEWRLSGLNDGFTWSAGSNSVGDFQTKPDNPLACIRFPSKGNSLMVMGSTVSEMWQDVGTQLFPYQRSSAFNIDYGCVNTATIATGDSFVIWVGLNEKSGLSIMYSTGGDIKQISTDGINFKFSNLHNPTNCYGFLFKLDGHLFYQLTFPDPEDNFTLLYDIDGKYFVYLTDEYMNHHIAKKMVYFNNTHYFISFIDGNLYELNSNYMFYNNNEIPRVRVTDTVRAQDNSQFIGNSLMFLMEQGQEPSLPYIEPTILKGTINISSDFPLAGAPKIGWEYLIGANVTDNDNTRTFTNQSFLSGDQIIWNGFNWDKATSVTSRIDMSISRDGGVSFGNAASIVMNRENIRKNKIIFWNLGHANEMTAQFRFWGLNRFLIKDGLINVYQ